MTDGPARPRFILASASPARLATLRQAGLDPEVIVSGVDETAVTAVTVPELVAKLATLKARAVADSLAHADHLTIVLGCDSLLELDGQPLGKPADAADAVARWKRMRGGSGILHTGHHLIVLSGSPSVRALSLSKGAADAAPAGVEDSPSVRALSLSEEAHDAAPAGVAENPLVRALSLSKGPTSSQVERTAVASTTVHFADVSDAEIEAYVATGEPLAVAGAFTVDGLGGAFVSGIEGDHHNVVGVSLPLFRAVLAEVGVAWTDLWAPGP